MAIQLNPSLPVDELTGEVSLNGDSTLATGQATERRWWLDHPHETNGLTCEHTIVAMETQPDERDSVREPDPTHLCENHCRSVF